MARQGRQPKQLQQPARATAQAAAPPAAAAASNKPKPAASRKAAAKAAAKAATAATPDTALDVYTHTNRVRRARGDVDPLARARSGSGRNAKAKGKGKGRAPPSDDDDDNDDDGAELEGADEAVEDSDDEDESGGFRVRGDTVVEFTGLKPAGFKLGMDSDDEARFVASDDSDEDIDSDLADEDSGDEGPLAGPSKGRAGAGARGKKAASAARQDKEVDLDEDEIDYDDEEGEGWMDLAEMLDAGGYPSEGDDDDDESASGSSEDAQGDEDEDEDMSADDDDDDASGALDKLDSFVEGLDSKKRKARDGDGDDDDGSKKKKRVVLAERTEAYPEGEFVAVKNDNGASRSLPLSSSRSRRTGPSLTRLVLGNRQGRPRRPPRVLHRLEEPAPRRPQEVAQDARALFLVGPRRRRQGHDDQLAPQGLGPARRAPPRPPPGQGGPRGGVRPDQGRDGQVERDGAAHEGPERARRRGRAA